MKAFKKVVAFTLAAALLAGCGSSGGGSSSSGNVLRYGSELDIQGMDSTVVDDGMSLTAIHAITDGLETIDENGEVAPGIAENYTVSDDQKTYTFNLRDAKWSNGDAVTANDFVYSWRRIIQTAGQYAYMLGSEGAAIKNADALMEKQGEGKELSDKDMETLGVTAKDEKTLVVELETPVPFFPELMTFPCYYPQNQKFVEEAGSKYGTEAEYTLSNGAFKMTKWTKTKSAVFEKNEDYWNADAVKLSGLEMELAMDPKSAAANFDSGKLDFAVISSSLVDKYADSEDLINYSEGYMFYLEINTKNKYLANTNIRKAISLAIDREDLCKSILKDGSTEADGFVPSGLAALDGKDFRESAEDFTKFDLDEAQKALDEGLKELGVSSISVDILYGTDESPMDIFAEKLQSDLKKLKGIDITMTATVKQDRIYNREKNGNFDIACTRWGPDYSDPTTYLNLNGSTNGNNYGKWSNAEYDKIMKQVQTETDTAKRWQLMIDAEKIAQDDYAKIPVFQKNGAALESSNVKGIVHKAVGVPYTFNYATVE